MSQELKTLLQNLATAWKNSKGTEDDRVVLNHNVHQLIKYCEAKKIVEPETVEA